MYEYQKAFPAMTAAAAICLSAPVLTAFADDDVPADDEFVTVEEIPLTDGIRRGEGYYEGVVIYQGGIDCIYDDDGNAYALTGGIGGNLKEGETRKSVEQEAIASIKREFESAGKDPDDYAFDLYLYFYDDYDYSPREFLDFVAEDSLARSSGNASPNPPTGTKSAAPFAALALAAACASLSAAGKSNSR